MATTVLKAYDECGYETMRLEVLPPSPFLGELENFIEAINDFGMSARDAGREIGELKGRMATINCNTTGQISNIDNRVLSLQSKVDANVLSFNSRLARLESDIRAMKEVIDKLRPVANAKTEKSNQKSDYLFLGGIGWSKEILDLEAGNIFLN